MLARILGLSVTLLALALNGNAAAACQAKNAIPVLDENFKTPDPGWGPPDDAASFTENGLVLKPPVNGSAWRWDSNFSLDGHDLCVTVVNPPRLPTNPGDMGDVGVWFWSKNGQSFYTATFSLNGMVSIDRLVNGVWHIVLAPTLSGAIKTGGGAANEVEIVIRGSTGSFFINGTKITDFRGDPPPHGGPPGVYAESGSSAVAWTFARVQLF